MENRWVVSGFRGTQRVEKAFSSREDAFKERARWEKIGLWGVSVYNQGPAWGGKKLSRYVK